MKIIKEQDKADKTKLRYIARLKNPAGKSWYIASAVFDDDSTELDMEHLIHVFFMRINKIAWTL